MVNWREELAARGAARVPWGLAPSRLAALQQATDSLLQPRDHRSPDFWCCPGPGGAQVLYRVHRFETHWPAVLTLLQAPEIVAVLDALYGATARPTALALCLKEPHVGAAVPWHRDPIDVPAQTVFNLSLNLDDSTPDNGCLAFVPGSHQNNEPVCAPEPPGLEDLPVEAGGILAHDVCVIHGSRQNPTPTRRRALVVEFQVR